jgi:hypothetical protein
MGETFTLTREERETIIRRSDADDTWLFSTLSPVVARQLERKGWAMQREGDSWSCRIPRTGITIRKAEPRKLTEKQRAVLARKAFKSKSPRQSASLDEAGAKGIPGQGGEGSAAEAA